MVIVVRRFSLLYESLYLLAFSLQLLINSLRQLFSDLWIEQILRSGSAGKKGRNFTWNDHLYWKIYVFCMTWLSIPRQTLRSSKNSYFILLLVFERKKKKMNEVIWSAKRRAIGWANTFFSLFSCSLCFFHKTLNITIRRSAWTNFLRIAFVVWQRSKYLWCSHQKMFMRRRPESKGGGNFYSFSNFIFFFSFWVWP